MYIIMINKPKWLLQFYSNNKAPMEVDRRFLSEKFLEDDNGLPVVSLKDLNPNRTIRIWEIEHDIGNPEPFLFYKDYEPYNVEISFKDE